MESAIDWPSPDHPAPQLCLLLHDAGVDAASLLPLAQTLRVAFGSAAIAAPDLQALWGEEPAPGPHDGLPDGGSAQAGPAPDDIERLRNWVAARQRRSGASKAATLLAGCGRGGDLALALVMTHDGCVGRVLSFGGRCHGVPLAAPQATTLHLLHAGADARVPPKQAQRQFEALAAAQADATLDIAEDRQDRLHPALIDAALARLRSHIPLRTWREALGAARAAPGRDDD